MECAGQQREPVEQPHCEQTSTFPPFTSERNNMNIRPSGDSKLPRRTLLLEQWPMWASFYSVHIRLR